MSHYSNEIKTSKKEMIARALECLPNQRGTKKEILAKIESTYNQKYNKNDSSYKTIE